MQSALKVSEDIVVHMHQRDYISQLVQEQLGFSLDELEEVSEGNMLPCSLLMTGWMDEED